MPPKCPICNGTGKLLGDICPLCDGADDETLEEPFDVEFPSAPDSGTGTSPTLEPVQFDAVPSVPSLIRAMSGEVAPPPPPPPPEGALPPRPRAKAPGLVRFATLAGLQRSVEDEGDAQSGLQEEASILQHVLSIRLRNPAGLLGGAATAREVARQMNEAVDEELAAWRARQGKSVSVSDAAEVAALALIRKSVVYECQQRAEEPMELSWIKEVDAQWTRFQQKASVQCFSGKGNVLTTQGAGPTALTPEQIRQKRLDLLGGINGSKTEAKASAEPSVKQPPAAKPDTAKPPEPKSGLDFRPPQRQVLGSREGNTWTEGAIGTEAPAPQPLPNTVSALGHGPKQTHGAIAANVPAPVPLSRNVSVPVPDDVVVLYATSVSLGEPSALNQESVRVLVDGLSKLQLQEAADRLLCYGTLTKLFANILENPDHEKFRRLKKGSKVIAKVEEILKAVGFKEQQEEPAPILVCPAGCSECLWESWPILLGHVRAFFVQCLQEWIHELSTKTDLADERWPYLKDEMFPKEILSTITKLLKAAFGPNPQRPHTDQDMAVHVNTALTEARAQGLQASFQALEGAPHAQKVAACLRALLDEITVQTLRSTAFPDDEPVFAAPYTSAAVQVVGSLRSGAPALVVRDRSGVSPWVQVLNLGHVAHVRHFRDIEDDVCEVLRPYKPGKMASLIEPQVPLFASMDAAVAWHVETFLSNQRSIDETHKRYSAVLSKRSRLKTEALALKEEYSQVEYFQCGAILCQTQHKRVVWRSASREKMYKQMLQELEDDSETVPFLFEIADFSAPMRESVKALAALGLDPEEVLAVPGVEQTAWSEPVHYASNYIDAMGVHLGRPPLPDDQLRISSGEEITFSELTELGEENMPAVFPIQMPSLAPPPIELHRSTSDRAWALPVALALSRARSVPHQDFSNKAEVSCWLSSTFQSLWHSTVFRFAFGCYLKSSERSLDSSVVLTAFSNTWRRYATGASPVSPDELQDALGNRGFEDVSAALNCLQNAFEASSNPVAKSIGESIASNIYVQLNVGCQLRSDVIGPVFAWSVCEQEGFADRPLIAVLVEPPHAEDNQMSGINVSYLTKQALADCYVPAHPQVEGFPDLGASHRLVAMVLLMDYPAHYVVVCRNQREPSKCRFFNDIPDLLQLPRVMNWDDVPTYCALKHLFPRLMLYESTDAARRVLRDYCRSNECKLM